MKKAVIVFRNKTDVFGFLDELASYGVTGSTTGTPKEAKIGCGIAAEVDISRLPLVRQIIFSGGYDGYYGIFTVERSGLRTTTARLY